MRLPSLLLALAASALTFVLPTTCSQLPLSPIPIAMSDNTFVNPLGPTLADVLTLQQGSSIFYDYVRDLPDVVGRLTDAGGDVASTVFVPRNKAVIGLTRKPHLGPVEDNIEILSGREHDERARKNVLKWISAHIIPSHPIELAGAHSTMLEGKSITFKCESEAERTWENCTIENGVKIVQRVEASNGVLYVIDGTITP
ncbi:hypothetical protein FRC09_006453 [Ceratobasidium sp. 395]|nr:hypothetical protein FRC09_006453 [Ceratobasidium sp. 395]